MARQAGIRSARWFPLNGSDGPVGILSIYSPHRPPPPATDENALVEIAAALAVVLANATSYWAMRDLRDQLEQSTNAAARVEQAKGALMRELDLRDPDAAHAALQDYAGLLDVDIEQAAAVILSGRRATAPAERRTQ